MLDERAQPGLGPIPLHLHGEPAQPAAGHQAHQQQAGDARTDRGRRGGDQVDRDGGRRDGCSAPPEAAHHRVRKTTFHDTDVLIVTPKARPGGITGTFGQKVSSPSCLTKSSMSTCWPSSRVTSQNGKRWWTASCAVCPPDSCTPAMTSRWTSWTPPTIC